jgi:hypothetical protein
MGNSSKFWCDLNLDRARLVLASAACLTFIGCAGIVKDVGPGGADGGSASGGSSGHAGGSRGTGGGIVIINNIGGMTGSGGKTGAGGTTGAGGAVSGSGGTTGLGGAPGVGGVTGSCSLFTPDDAWNTDVSAKAVDTANTAKVNALLGAVSIHPDFGSDFGIPFNTVPANQAGLPITFSAYPDESDPGPYPFPPPATAIIEGGSATACSGDCHMIAVQLGSCQLYEGYGCNYTSGWTCANGAHWDLTKKSQGQRPNGWTSADAGGLPIYAGLARYSEYLAGQITHAIRFTLPCTSDTMVAPATHEAVPGGGCSTNPNAVPMGLRIRLKATFDISSYTPTAQIFLKAFKRYGLILADNGGKSSTLYFQSEQNPSWKDDEINDLKRVPVSAFEAVVP